jgi:inner membrane protein
MDVTTHVTVGAFAACGVAKGRSDAKVVWTAVFLGSMAPDVDSVLYLVDPHLYFQYHRVFTHTVLGVVVLSALTAGVITVSSGRCSLLRLAPFALFGGIIHLALDTLTRYPLRPLAPISSANYALGLLSWRDPFLKIVAFVGIPLVLLLPRAFARPVFLAGFLLMAGRVTIALLFHP